MWQEQRSHGAVVVEQVAFGDALDREEDLVEIRELQLARPLLDDIGDRLFAPYILGSLVLAQTLVGRRTQASVMCPLCEYDLCDELRLHPDDIVLSHLGHLRYVSKRRTVAAQRS
jgi:hypothetical protein